MKYSKYILPLAAPFLFAFTSYAQFQTIEEGPSGKVDTIYYPFQNDIQMIVINHYDAWRSKVSFMEQSRPRAMSWSNILGPTQPNVYVFRNKKGEILNVYNAAEESFLKHKFRNVDDDKLNYLSNEPKALLFYNQVDSETNQDKTKQQTTPWYLSDHNIIGGQRKKGLFSTISGEVVLEAKYDAIVLNKLYEQKAFIVINNGKFGWIDSTYKEDVAIQFELIDGDIKYSKINRSHIITKKDGLWGIIDETGNVLMDFKYTNIIDYLDYYAYSTDGSVGMFDPKTFDPIIASQKYTFIKQRVSVYPILDREEYLVRKNGKYGYVGRNNQIILPLEYDSILSRVLWAKERQWWHIVKKDDHYGVFNQNFELVIPIEFDTIYQSHKTIHVKKDEKWGFYDHNYKLISEPIFDNIYWVRGYYVLIKDGKYGLLNEHFDNALLIILPKYTTIRYLKNNYLRDKIYFNISIDGKKGVLEATKGVEKF
ncbi:hypothetical protein ERX46_10755 [Brumimicrobium glaciale]|uniref:WG repeat-containing protein n=1 Tax=Brumimicrobium glaciale TaxID=200475 RepID=A0A4Q4KJI6_9FLAO|nr:WG repeat-containing protein [Brumimicrobium glaciale]RYM33412.1 hypothetical protein ERX46_10755 [Brumimicrobium glaciale]